MPYISMKTTASISGDTGEKIKTAFGKAIECFPGKTERWLMVNLCGDEKLWLAGDASCDSAIIEVAIFGKAARAAYDKMTACLTDIVSSELGISPSRIYIKYAEVEQWGWNGSNF